MKNKQKIKELINKHSETLNKDLKVYSQAHGRFIKIHKGDCLLNSIINLFYIKGSVEIQNEEGLELVADMFKIAKLLKKEME